MVGFTGGELVSSEDAIRIYQSLSANGIQVWLTGGWGIDALLQMLTRPHKDLDIIMLADDIVRMRDLLGREGFGLKELWSENSWIVDGNGIEIPTAFVLRDPEGREVDVHAMRLDEQGGGIPAWQEERLVFRREDLAGEGMIARLPVRCISPEMQVRCHMGYDLPDQQVCDLELLREMLTATSRGEAKEV
jgi:lincosamide nucleotidyltransferase A/C/D/E